MSPENSRSWAWIVCPSRSVQVRIGSGPRCGTVGFAGWAASLGVVSAGSQPLGRSAGRGIVGAKASGGGGRSGVDGNRCSWPLAFNCSRTYSRSSGAKLATGMRATRPPRERITSPPWIRTNVALNGRPCPSVQVRGAGAATVWVTRRTTRARERVRARMFTPQGSPRHQRLPRYCDYNEGRILVIDFPSILLVFRLGQRVFVNRGAVRRQRAPEKGVNRAIRGPTATPRPEGAVSPGSLSEGIRRSPNRPARAVRRPRGSGRLRR